MIVTRGLTKRYGTALAVDDLDITVTPGVVTGFLGPNGSGKSSTMRMIMGLDRPTSGYATVNGMPYEQLRWPLREVGALLHARSFHPGRTAYDHLRVLAQTNAIPRSRIDDVLEIVGLTSVARQRTGRFSLGMGQRLGIAAALLGDPGVLLFDEPVNGLDPEGIRWVRRLLRSLAAEGRTILVSSHLISEMALTAGRLVVIGRGALIVETSVDDFVARTSADMVRIVTPTPQLLVRALSRSGARPVIDEDGGIVVSGISSAAAGELAAAHALTVHELIPVRTSLEDAFMELTSASVEYGSHTDGATHDRPRRLPAMSSPEARHRAPGLALHRRPTRPLHHGKDSA